MKGTATVLQGPSKSRPAWSNTSQVFGHAGFFAFRDGRTRGHSWFPVSFRRLKSSKPAVVRAGIPAVMCQTVQHMVLIMDWLMMDWLILCLLVPAIVVPVVLLWGFVGCSFEAHSFPVAPILRVTPLSSTAVSLAWDNPSTALTVKVQRRPATVPGLPAPDFETVAEVPWEMSTVYDGETGLAAGASFEYQVSAVNQYGETPSNIVRVDLFFKSAFERTSTDSLLLPDVTGVRENQPGVEGICFVQKIAAARLLRTGTNVKITLRCSTATGANLQIDRIFISSPNLTGNAQDSDPDDLTRVASNVLLLASDPPVAVGPTAMTMQGNKIYILNNTKDLIIAFDVGTPGNARFGALEPPSGAESFAKASAAEAAMATRPNYPPPAPVLYLIEKIEVLEMGKDVV
jgi:hypothetical protein